MTSTRWALAGILAVWTTIALAEFSVTIAAAWAPDLVGIFAAVAAVATAAVLLAPGSSPAYVVAGAAGIGTLCLRTVSVLSVIRAEPDFDLFVASAGAVTVLAAACYWHWWLTAVADWRHEAAR